MDVLPTYRSAKPESQKGEWDFAWVRTVLVERSLPDLRVLGQTPVDDGTCVQWGAAVRRAGDDLLVYGVLVYGVVDEGPDKHLVAAKAPLSGPGTGWMYRTADQRWSSQPWDVGRLLTGVSNEFTVLPPPGKDPGWLLVTSCARLGSDQPESHGLTPDRDFAELCRLG